MRKLFLITVMFLSVVTLAQAQRGNGQRPSQAGEGQRPRMNPEQMMQRQLDRINEAVNLTDVQKEKVKEIIQKNGEKQRELFQTMRDSGEQPDREKMREKMGEIRKKQDNEIKAVLTKDQVAKYEQLLKEREERMKEWMKNRSGGGKER